MRTGCGKIQNLSKGTCVIGGPCQLLLSTLYFLFAVSCSNPSPSVKYYEEISSEHKSSSAPGYMEVRSGKLKVSSSNILYDASGKIISSGDIQNLPPSLQKIILEKYLLRKMAIEEGLRQDYYSGGSFENYILPRYEKILEDYYYYKSAERNQGRVEAVQKLLSKNPPVEVRYAEN